MQQTHRTNVIKDLKACAHMRILGNCEVYNSDFLIEYMLDVQERLQWGIPID